MHMTTLAITGALGYSGKAIAQRLFARGLGVRTLTNSPNRPNPFGAALDIRPLAFDHPASLTDSLRGCDTLINTYWVRFNHRLFTFDQAVANTRTLFAAAKAAGVRRIVHVSIMNPDADPSLAYYRGKAALERDLRALDLPHAIVRPGVLFGRSDILVNNIAWGLRHFPVFPLFGDGEYRLQPMHVDDFADLVVDAALDSTNLCLDANGPETYSFRGLAQTLARILNLRRVFLPTPAPLACAAARLLGPFLHDTILTREEIRGLMGGLLASAEPSRGRTRLSDWAARHRDTLGFRYASEVVRRVDRARAYDALGGKAEPRSAPAA